MELQTLIDPRIWDTIRSNYENQDYSGAILDAIHYLSNLLREKADVEGDGVALVGQALGGKTPRLKINKLQTETDWNIQIGFEQIIRGIYQGIRNPRSHEKYTDKRSDADAIIYFINFIVTEIIDKSKTPFIRSEFLKRIFDPDFVENNRYATLLVKEIPTKQRFDVFLDAFSNKENGQGTKLRYFFHALFKKLSKEEKNQIYHLISQELKETDNSNAIIRIIQIIPTQYWEKYEGAARLRIENKLIESIKGGLYIRKTDKCLAGSLGTWASNIYKYFKLKTELLHILTNKLESNNKEVQDYVFKFFFRTFEDLAPKPTRRLQQVIIKGLQSGDDRFWDALTGTIIWGSEEWKKAFDEPYKNFKVKEQEEIETEEESVPF